MLVPIKSRFSYLLLLFTASLLSVHHCTYAFAPLAGATALSVDNGDEVELDKFLTSTSGEKTMLVLATYAADFNAIEYAQRLRFYLPELEKRGIKKIGLVLNCEEKSALTLAEMVALPTVSSKTGNSSTQDQDNKTKSDTDLGVTLLVDPLGKAGRQFGVGRGWRPEDEEMSPYLKLFGMLWGLGAWATLPAVIGGYIGNPFTPQPWIEDALAVGQRQKRWPDNALELDDKTGEVITNKFTELPVVGEWPRRPLELATLRLQNMVDISIKNWKELAPSKDALDAGVLTQLGGCVICDSKGESLFEFRDPGICAVVNFEDILKKIPVE